LALWPCWGGRTTPFGPWEFGHPQTGMSQYLLFFKKKKKKKINAFNISKFYYFNFFLSFFFLMQKTRANT
jgi:hypothetical protein